MKETEDLSVRRGWYWTQGGFKIEVHSKTVLEANGVEVWTGCQPMKRLISWLADGKVSDAQEDPRYNLCLSTWGATPDQMPPIDFARQEDILKTIENLRNNH